MCAAPAPTGQNPTRPGITPIQWVGLAVLVLLLANQMGLFGTNGAGGITGYLQSELPRFIAIVLAITVHEFSHGFVATLFGDDLPRRVGRLTLNPLKHLDPLGTLMILFGPIGWGRPMPINPSGMRNPSLGWALSSLAGPVSNILAAIVAATVIGLTSSSGETLFYIRVFITVNVGLAIFNLIPIPPLDGFGFVFGLAPYPVKVALRPLQTYGMFILLAFLFIPPLTPLVNRFFGAGLGIIIPPLQAICQCPNPVVLRF